MASLVALIGVFAFQLIGPASVVPTASAQAVTSDVNIADFTDPVTGQINIDAYLAAVAAENLRIKCAADPTLPECGGGNLPKTGSSSNDLIALGVGLIVVGGVAIVSARRLRRTASASNA